jgi:hypothetical protein
LGFCLDAVAGAEDLDWLVVLVAITEHEVLENT